MTQLSVLMIGPGKGHNVKRFLDYFQENTDNKLSYFYFNFGNHYSFKEFTNIDTFSYLQICKLIRILRIKSLDIIWIHNWCPLPLILMILFFKKRETVLNYDIWSEQIPRMIQTKSFSSLFYRYFIKKCDYLQCHWFSTYRYFENIKQVNPILIPWGIEREYFESNEFKLFSFTEKFINKIDSSKYSFFIPKSINIHNRHDIVIEAASLLKQRGIKNFVVYMWLGNHINNKLLDAYKERIIDLNIHENINIVQHPFLPIPDVKIIWKKMDCCLQLLNNDQLSTSILEAMIFKKEIIASDILSYRVLNEKAGLNISLVSNDARCVANQMSKKILGDKTPEKELEKRSMFVKETRQFEKNIVGMLNTFSKKPIKHVL